MLRKKVVAVNGFYQKYCTFATDTAKDATGTTLTPTIYHNALKNTMTQTVSLSGNKGSRMDGRF